MRVLKLLSVAAMVSAAFSVTNAMAQTQNIPVSCNWVHASSQSGASAAIVTFQCKEANNNVAATRSLTYSAPTWQVTYCTISLASGVYNSGTCQNSSLYRTVAPLSLSSSQCQNVGKYVGSGCAVSISSSDGFGQYFQQQCGPGCTPRYESLGFINGCYSGPPNGSPYVNVYCQ